MHITFLALGSRGDIQPYATLGQALRAAGHRVAFATAENYAPLVAAHGLDFYPIAGDVQALVRQTGANMLALVRSFVALAKEYGAVIPAPIKSTDLIINQLPLGMCGYDLAEKYGVPMAVATVIPFFPTGSFPMVGFPRLPGPGYNRLTYALAQQAGWQFLRPLINRWRRSLLGLRPAPFRGYFDRLGTVSCPMVNGFSAHVVPRPPDWGEAVHTTGWWFPEEPAWEPPPELARFLEAGLPPVFIGFGSMPVRRPEQTTRLIVEALKQSGQRGILQSGWGDLGGVPLPETVFKIEYVPYGWLFPRMALVVHHGGSGTVGSGLRSGVPNLVVPFMFDQFFWGERIAALGAGPRPIPFKRLTAGRLAQAITSAVFDLQMRRRAAALGQKLQAENGVARAVEIVEGRQRDA
jgi:sterol 3beta-glucosyltransferase